MSEMDRQLRARAFIQRIADLGGEVVLNDGGGVQIRLEAGVTAELREEGAALKPDLLELLLTEGVETIDAEEKQHSGMHTPPRSAAEVDKQRADADRSRERARRRYQGGMVLVNDRNNFGHYMRQLRQQREASEARERGELPPEGKYATKFEIF